jgi:hypothetical protein
MKYIKYFEYYTFNDIYKKKNRWIQLLNDNKLDEIKDNLFILVNNAYSKLGGNKVIKSPEDIFKRNYWEAIDIDQDPDADALIFGRKTNFGIKITGIGHDGNKSSKKKLIEKLYNQLKKRGYYMEASGKVKEKLDELDTPYIKNKNDIEKIIGNIYYKNNGNYLKILSKNEITEDNRLFGSPII